MKAAIVERAKPAANDRVELNVSIARSLMDQIRKAQDLESESLQRRASLEEVLVAFAQAEDFQQPRREAPDAQAAVQEQGRDRGAVEQVGQVAAEIRSWRKPEPYKGKGIRYDGEFVRRKLGKAAKGD